MKRERNGCVITPRSISFSSSKDAGRTQHQMVTAGFDPGRYSYRNLCVIPVAPNRLSYSYPNTVQILGTFKQKCRISKPQNKQTINEIQFINFSQFHFVSLLYPSRPSSSNTHYRLNLNYIKL